MYMYICTLCQGRPYLHMYMLGMVMYANKVKTKKINKKLPEIKNQLQHKYWRKKSFGFNVQIEHSTGISHCR